MGTDEKINDLQMKLESMKKQMDYLHDQIGYRTAEILGLRIIMRTLAKTHPDRAGFERVLLSEHEALLADAIPSEWSDTQIDFATRMALAPLRN